MAVGALGTSLAAEPVPSPPARRLRQPSWLDLRLVTGVLLVLGSVVFGSRLVAAADASTQVWAVTGDLATGTTLGPGDLRGVRVHLYAGSTRYVGTGASPVGRTLTRRIGGGELLPRAALTDTAPGALLSLPVPTMHAPDSLRRGQLIDVFASTKAAGSGTAARTQRILAGVAVQDVRAPRGGLSGGGMDYAVLVRVPEESAAILVSAVRTADIDVAVVTGPAAGRTS